MSRHVLPAAPAPAAVAVALLAGLAPVGALGQEPPPSCLPAYENTQLLRMKGAFRAARDAAKTCAQATCQQALRSDCLQWLGELERTIPTVVLEARSERGEEVDVRVLLDGALLQGRLDGAPIELDPGPHTFGFELADRPPVEQRVVLKAGDKLRVLSAAFDAQRSAAPSPPAPLPPAVPLQRPTPRLVYALGGLAAAGGLAFGAFAISGKSLQNSLEESCAPFCSSGDVSRVRRRYALADVSIGVGVVSLGAAIVLYLARPETAATVDQGRSLDLLLTARSARFAYGRSF